MQQEWVGYRPKGRVGSQFLSGFPGHWILLSELHSSRAARCRRELQGNLPLETDRERGSHRVFLFAGPDSAMGGNWLL